MDKKIIFGTTYEADDFKLFLNQKGVKYAKVDDKCKVIITSPITEQQFYHLLIKFGKWY